MGVVFFGLKGGIDDCSDAVELKRRFIEGRHVGNVDRRSAEHRV
jgi:hypothetical protein